MGAGRPSRPVLISIVCLVKAMAADFSVAVLTFVSCL